MNPLTEHIIDSYQKFGGTVRCRAVVASSIRTIESLLDTEQQIVDLALLGKQSIPYRKLKPVTL